MWTTTLPTGTVRDEGRGRRTFPKQSTSSSSGSGQRPRRAAHPRQNHPPRRSQPHHGSGSTVAQQSELDRLREENRQAKAEIERLESQLDQFRTRLANHNRAKQAMIDRYEHIIAELESAAATASTSTAESAATTTNQTTQRGLVSRLTRWL